MVKKIQKLVNVVCERHLIPFRIQISENLSKFLSLHNQYYHNEQGKEIIPGCECRCSKNDPIWGGSKKTTTKYGYKEKHGHGSSKHITRFRQSFIY